MNAREKHTLMAIGLLALLGAAIVSAHVVQDTQPAAAPTQPAAVPATTAIAARERMPIVATGIGTVTPLQSVLVRPRIDGALDTVTFREGQTVSAGALLARLDARALQAQLAQAEAQTARDQALLANARVDLARYTRLAAQDSIATQQLDTQRATVAQLEATVKLDQAQVDSAEVQLDYATIRSPIRGRTGKRLVDPGNLVHAADTTGIVTINQVDPISVLFTLPEDRFQAVVRAQADARGQPLAVQAWGRTDGKLLAGGRLTLVNNEIDTATGTFQLRAVFANATDALWPGQYVDVRVVLRELPDAVTVPSAAMQRGPQGLYVYVVRPDDTVAMQTVALLQDDGAKAIVAQGIAAGVRVVVGGQYKLRPGVRVAEANPG